MYLIYKFIQVLHGFALNWAYLNFLDFYEKHRYKKKKVRINYFDEQEKPWIFQEKKAKLWKPSAPL